MPRPLGEPLVVWSLGCGTGAEGYGALFTLLDAGLAGSDVRLYGADLVEARLERARAGAYAPRELAAGIKPAWAEAHMVPVEGGWRVTVVGAIRREATIEAGGDVTAHEVEAATIRTDGALAVTGDVVRALARVRAQRRAEAEAQLAKLRPMLDAPALGPAMRAKVVAAIAALEARLAPL